MMAPGSPEEFKNKISMSWGMLVFILVITVSVTVACVGLFGLQGFVNAELIGVRKDMEKEDQHLKEQIEAVNKRIDRKIENHNNDKKAHK